MKKIFAAILISAIAWMPGTAIAEVPAHPCLSKNDIIKQPDPLIFICKNPVKASEAATVSHNFYLYKFSSDQTPKAILGLTVYTEGDRLVTIGEMGSEKTVQFWVRDHKFVRWSKPQHVDADTVDRYRKEVTTLLNTADVLTKNFEQF